jgi:DNA repair exonuclease SbcCD ATPase subunit
MTDNKEFYKETLPAADCPGKILPTPREKEALDAMRAIKERVRELKKRLRHMEAADDENHKDQIAETKDELVRLKSDWNELEKKWQAHVKERMIYLGHDEA